MCHFSDFLSLQNGDVWMRSEGFGLQCVLCPGAAHTVYMYGYAHMLDSLQTVTLLHLACLGDLLIEINRGSEVY